MTDKETIDWRAVLVKYIRHVDDREGYIFLADDDGKHKFTEKEWAGLVLAAKEACERE